MPVEDLGGFAINESRDDYDGGELSGDGGGGGRVHR